MSQSRPYKPVMDSYSRRCNQVEVVAASLDELESKVKADRVGKAAFKSCAMIGCGYGAMELAFLKRCLPEVTELIAVEPDADSVAELKLRVAERLPNARLVVHQETAQSWIQRQRDQLVDVVLIFHSLYYVHAVEYPAFFLKLFDEAVAADGLVLILADPCQCETSPSICCLMDKLLRSQAWTFDHINTDRIRQLMTAVGFSLFYERTIVAQLDVEGMAEDNGFLSLFLHEHVGMEQVRAAAEQVIGEAKTLPDRNWLVVFRKP